MLERTGLRGEERFYIKLPITIQKSIKCSCSGTQVQNDTGIGSSHHLDLRSSRRVGEMVERTKGKQFENLRLSNLTPPLFVLFFS